MFEWLFGKRDKKRARRVTGGDPFFGAVFSGDSATPVDQNPGTPADHHHDHGHHGGDTGGHHGGSGHSCSSHSCGGHSCGGGH